MSESIKTGGVGKSPAIEKINRLNEIAGLMQAASELEKRAFDVQQEKMQRERSRRNQIIKDFHISFKLEENRDEDNI
ncbi:MAG: hypothetical protein J6C64_05200 [Lachnospiraceae bacterium]|nr:hypothetical protein [Lachnospiraceae bacterium]